MQPRTAADIQDPLARDFLGREQTAEARHRALDGRVRQLRLEALPVKAEFIVRRNVGQFAHAHLKGGASHRRHGRQRGRQAGGLRGKIAQRTDRVRQSHRSGTESWTACKICR